MDPSPAVFESVARYFGVLGEPTRLRILHALCRQERCVNDIIRVAGLAQANGSRHLGLMYQAGLLSRRREGTQVFYRVAEPMHQELCRSLNAQIDCRAEADAQPGSHSVSGESVHLPPSHLPANPKEEASAKRTQ